MYYKGKTHTVDVKKLAETLHQTIVAPFIDDLCREASDTLNKLAEQLTRAVGSCVEEALDEVEEGLLEATHGKVLAVNDVASLLETVSNLIALIGALESLHGSLGVQ